MGNPDLIIYINGWYSIVIEGKDYETQVDAVSAAASSFVSYVRNLNSSEGLDGAKEAIKKIRVEETWVLQYLKTEHKQVPDGE